MNTVEVFAPDLFKVYPKKKRSSNSSLLLRQSWDVRVWPRSLVNAFRLYFTTLLRLQRQALMYKPLREMTY